MRTLYLKRGVLCPMESYDGIWIRCTACPFSINYSECHLGVGAYNAEVVNPKAFDHIAFSATNKELLLALGNDDPQIRTLTKARLAGNVNFIPGQGPGD